MKIILLKHVEGLGVPFSVVDVKDGYARNYLLPRNLAVIATAANMRGIESNKQRFSKTMSRMKKIGVELADKLNNTTIKTHIKTAMDGKSFGSITTHDLADLLQNEGIDIDKKSIILDDPIKHPGVYDIKVHLAEKIDAIFKLVVIEETE